MELLIEPMNSVGGYEPGNDYDGGLWGTCFMPPGGGGGDGGGGVCPSDMGPCSNYFMSPGGAGLGTP